MAGSATAVGVTTRLLLDEDYAAEIARELRDRGYDVIAVVEDTDLRAQPDGELFRWAASHGRRIVTENIKDFRPLLARAYTTGDVIAPVLLVSPRRFPRGTGNRAQAIVDALQGWLKLPDVSTRPDEDWLSLPAGQRERNRCRAMISRLRYNVMHEQALVDQV